MAASPRRPDEIATPGLGWGLMAGASTALALTLMLSRIQTPSPDLSAETLWTSLIFWAILAPLHILIGSMFGGLAGTACCAASVHHTRLAAIIGGTVAGLLVTIWLQTLL